MSAKLQNTPTTSIDPDDAPELDDDFFQRADLLVGEQVMRRGRPTQAVTKTAVKLRLDPDVVAAFKAQGRGWQTRINALLREAVSQGKM